MENIINVLAALFSCRSKEPQAEGQEPVPNLEQPEQPGAVDAPVAPPSPPPPAPLPAEQMSPNRGFKWSKELQNVVGHPEGVEHFRQFLTSLESDGHGFGIDKNLDFWLDLEKFKELSNEKQVTRARELYNEYFGVLSTNDLQLIKSRIHHGIAQRGTCSEEFIEAQEVVWKKLGISYQQFMNSMAYKDLRDAATLASFGYN